MLVFMSSCDSVSSPILLISCSMHFAFVQLPCHCSCSWLVQDMTLHPIWALRCLRSVPSPGQVWCCACESQLEADT